MPGASMKTLNQLLDSPQSDLQQMLQKAQQIQRLHLFLQPFLPEPLRSECIVSNYQASQLKIVVSNASVATTLRFLIPQLLRHLHTKQYWSFLQDITITIQKRVQNEPDVIAIAKNQPKRSIPNEAIAGFQWLASQEEDVELRRALERMGGKKPLPSQ